MISHGLTVGEWIRYDSNTVTTDDQQGFAKAKADLSDNAETVGIVVSSANSNEFVYAYAGEIITTAWKVVAKDGTTTSNVLVPGKTYYLSHKKAGYIQDFRPEGEDTKVRIQRFVDELSGTLQFVATTLTSVLIATKL